MLKIIKSIVNIIVPHNFNIIAIKASRVKNLLGLRVGGAGVESSGVVVQYPEVVASAAAQRGHIFEATIYNARARVSLASCRTRATILSKYFTGARVSDQGSKVRLKNSLRKLLGNGLRLLLIYLLPDCKGGTRRMSRRLKTTGL